MNRYEKYKDSGIAWIGEIPEGWQLVKAKNIFMQRSTKGSLTNVLLSATQKNGMCPQHLVEGVVQVKQGTDLSTFKTVLINDFVISLRSFQGGFEMSEYEGVCSPAYQVFYNKTDIYHKFHKYLFKSYGFISQINAFTMGIREGKNIQYFDFSLMYLPTPSVAEQEVIAEFLDRKCGEIDEAVALQETMIGELVAYKQSVITEAVTRGLNPDAPLRDSGIEWIGSIPAHWEVAQFKRCVSINNGRDYKDIVAEVGYPVIGSGGVFTYASDFIYDGEALLLGRKGTIDKPMHYIGKFWTVDTMFYAITNHIAFCRYYYYHAHFFPYRMYSTSTALPSMTANALLNNNVCIPPLQEQQAIADHLDRKCEEIDQLIAIKREKIEQLKEYKKSVIFEYVTGKKRVN